MKIIDIVQRTTTWHAWRPEGVTASEAAVVLGRSPYKSRQRLFRERTGLSPAEDLSTKPCVQRGIAFEDHVRRGFEQRHDTILLPLCAESTEQPVLRCSLDGLNDDGEPVELKVPTEKTYRLVAKDGEQAIAYKLAWVQLQHQLYVTEAEQGWLVFDPWLADLSPLEFLVERNDRFIETELIPAALRFWKAIDGVLNGSLLTPSTSFYF